MKTRILTTVLVFLLALIVGQSQAEPMGTAFTYQGRLIDANEAADGEYDFEFKLYDDPTAGTQQGSTIYLNEVDVIDGYFTVGLDFGSGVFDGDARWLQIGIRPGEQNDPNVYTTLSPRQEVTPTPYALYAKSAQTAGSDNDWMVSGNDMYSIPSGNVGIGTDSPTEARLEISPAVAQRGIYIHGTSHSEIEMGPSTANIYANGPFYLGPRTDHDLYFVTQNVGGTKMIIKNNGNVGIGITSPSYKLHVNGTLYASTVNTGLGNHELYAMNQHIRTTDSPTFNRVYLSDYGTALGGFHVGGTSDPGIDNLIVDGKVGIGTPTPQEELHVSGDILLNYGKSLKFKDSTGGISPVMSMWYDGGNNGIDITNFAAGRIALLTSSTPGACGNVLTVTPEGYVIIGAVPEAGGSTPSEELHVEGKVWIKEMDGTGSGSLVRWYNGRLCRDTSSKRYKEDIKPLEDDFCKILGADPKSFIDKTSSRREIGFIAEEFDELGLGNLVIYKDGQPDALKYELVSLYLLEVLKEQVKATKQLEIQNRTLEQKFAALEKAIQNQQFALAKEVQQ